MQLELTRVAAPWRRPERLPLSDAFRQMVVDLAGAGGRGQPPYRRRRNEGPTWRDRAAWLRSLPLDVAERVAGAVATRRLAAGQRIIQPGDELPGWLGVVEGFAATCDADRSDATGLGLPCGTWYGEQEMLLDAGAARGLVASVHSTIAVLPRLVFDELVDSEPSFARAVLQIQAQRASALHQQVRWPRRLGTDAYVGLRIAALFSVEAFYDSGYHVGLTQSALSAFLGLSRQRTNEALNRLRRLDEVHLVYGGLRVKNPPRLMRRALQGEIP